MRRWIVGNGLNDVKPSPNSALCILFMRLRVAEIGQDAIADVVTEPSNFVTDDAQIL